MEGCIFCKIVRREIPAIIKAESSTTVAFQDVSPQAPVHVLVIPKEHVKSVMEVSETHAKVLAEMVLLAQKCARQEGVEKTGFRLVFNCGPDAGQAVDHIHMHLLGKRKLSWPPG